MSSSPSTPLSSSPILQNGALEGGSPSERWRTAGFGQSFAMILVVLFLSLAFFILFSLFMPSSYYSLAVWLVVLCVFFVSLRRTIKAIRNRLNGEPDEDGSMSHTLFIRPHGTLHLALLNRELHDGDYETLLLLDEPVRQEKQRLFAARQEQIDALPTYDVPANVNNNRPEPCAICLESLQPGETMRSLPCMHAYHKHCVDTWLRIQASCPICKFQI